MPLSDPLEGTPASLSHRNAHSGIKTAQFSAQNNPDISHAPRSSGMHISHRSLLHAHPPPAPLPVTGCVSQPLISAPSDATPSARTATPNPPSPSCKAQLNGPLVRSWCPRSEALWLQRLAFVHKHGRMVVEGRAVLPSLVDGGQAGKDHFYVLCVAQFRMFIACVLLHFSWKPKGPILCTFCKSSPTKKKMRKSPSVNDSTLSQEFIPLSETAWFLSPAKHVEGPTEH